MLRDIMLPHELQHELCNQDSWFNKEWTLMLHSSGIPICHFYMQEYYHNSGIQPTMSEKFFAELSTRCVLHLPGSLTNAPFMDARLELLRLYSTRPNLIGNASTVILMKAGELSSAWRLLLEPPSPNDLLSVIESSSDPSAYILALQYRYIQRGRLLDMLSCHLPDCFGRNLALDWYKCYYSVKSKLAVIQYHYDFGNISIAKAFYHTRLIYSLERHAGISIGRMPPNFFTESLNELLLEHSLDQLPPYLLRELMINYHNRHSTIPVNYFKSTINLDYSRLNHLGIYMPFQRIPVHEAISRWISGLPSRGVFPCQHIMTMEDLRRIIGEDDFGIFYLKLEKPVILPAEPSIRLPRYTCKTFLCILEYMNRHVTGNTAKLEIPTIHRSYLDFKFVARLIAYNIIYRKEVGLGLTGEDIRSFYENIDISNDCRQLGIPSIVIGDEFKEMGLSLYIPIPCLVKLVPRTSLQWLKLLFTLFIYFCRNFLEYIRF